MSEGKTHAATRQGLLAASAAASEFTELWKNVSKFSHNKTQDNKKANSAAGNASPLFADLQSPKRISWLSGLNNSDSPGDVEPSQDIFWDSTSPTPTNSGYKCTKVEISDLVNRIAPKDVKTLRTELPLLQWIGDSAVPGTPDFPKQRVRKRSSRQNSVEDLMKLARQFDENMQQNKETCEQLNILNNNVSKSVSENVPHVLTWDAEEAELHALFDCSTQKVSGRLSQGSTASTCSILKPTEKDDFDDDWENDDLLNDSLLLAITQNSEQHSATTKTDMQSNTKQSIYDGKSFEEANHGTTFSSVNSKPSCSALQALCTKPKTKNRSTFKIGPNPDFQPTTELAKEQPKSNFTALKSSNQAEQQTADDLWDDVDDDLLYQVCDSVERISQSNSQPHQENPADCQDKHNITVNVKQKNTVPLPIKTTCSTNSSASMKSCAFVRSNSLPGTSSDSVNYKGWNNPMKGATNKAGMSQSLPESHVNLKSFSKLKHSSGSFQHFNLQPHTETPLQKSCHTAFKRNVSDSAVLTNKVFVTSQMTGKCSVAEIEKKKQEALSRRRQRMQNTPKP